MSTSKYTLEELKNISDYVYTMLYEIFPNAKFPVEYQTAHGKINELIAQEGQSVVTKCDDYRPKMLANIIQQLDLSELTNSIDIDTLSDILKEMTTSQNKKHNDKIRDDATEKIYNALMAQAKGIGIKSYQDAVKSEIAKLSLELERKNVEEGYVDLDLKDDIDDLNYQEYLLEEIESTLQDPNNPNANEPIKRVLENVKNTIRTRLTALSYMCPPSSPAFYKLVQEALETMFETNEWFFAPPTFKTNLIDSIKKVITTHPQITELLNNAQQKVDDLVAEQIKTNYNPTPPLFDDDEEHLYSEEYMRYNHPDEVIPQDEFVSAPKLF